MVSTNLFGRGVDIPRVNVVINYDMTEDPDSYLHRVGNCRHTLINGLRLAVPAVLAPRVLLSLSLPARLTEIYSISASHVLL